MNNRRINDWCITGLSALGSRARVLLGALVIVLHGPACVPVAQIDDGPAQEDSDFLQGRDPDSFLPASPLDSFSLAGLRPADPATYIELRWTMPQGVFEIRSSLGAKCAEADDTDACVSAFHGVTADRGFAEGCIPAGCFFYLAVNRGDENFVIRDRSEMLSFFGSINTPEEALLLAADSNYSWQGGGRTVRKTDEGFELVVTKLTGFCDPVELTRFLLGVSSDGTTEVLSSEVISSEEGVCI